MTTSTDATRSEISEQHVQESENIELPISRPLAVEDNVESFTVSRRLATAMFTLALLSLLVALHGTSVSTAVPIVAQRIHGTALEAWWVGVAYLLTSTVFQPNIASFSHIFGRMPLLMGSLAFFLIGTLLSGTAKGFHVLITGRAIQGIGGGGDCIRKLLCDFGLILNRYL